MRVFFALACACAVLPGIGGDPSVRLAGSLGERFDLTVRGNFMKLDLEKDFFRPFVERKTE